MMATTDTRIEEEIKEALKEAYKKAEDTQEKED